MRLGSYYLNEYRDIRSVFRLWTTNSKGVVSNPPSWTVYMNLLLLVNPLSFDYFNFWFFSVWTSPPRGSRTGSYIPDSVDSVPTPYGSGYNPWHPTPKGTVPFLSLLTWLDKEGDLDSIVVFDSTWNFLPRGWNRGPWIPYTSKE